MDTEFTEINITPFTDVLLVLLVIFMILAALLLPPGFERALPCNCSGPAPFAQTRPVDVLISKAGIITVDGARTSESGLYGVLAAAARHSHKVKLRVLADARARYGLVIRVLDAAKLAAIADVSFVTQ